MSENASENPVIRDVFSLLNQKGVAYCVLRNDERMFLEPDIDLLVSKRDSYSLDSLFTQLGFIKFSIPQTSTDRFYLCYDCVLDRFVLIQVAFSLHYGRTKFFHDAIAERILECRLAKKDYFVPHPEDQYRLLLMHCLLDKQSFERYQEDLLELGRNITSDMISIPGIGFLRPQDLDDQSFPKFLEKRNRVRLACLGQSVKKEFPGYIFRIIQIFIRKLMGQKPIRPGLRVAFIGVDGVGKSTIIERLARRLTWPFYPRIVYMGDNQYVLPFVRVVHNLKNRSTKPSLFLSGLYLFFGTIDKWLRAAYAYFCYQNGEIVLFDRWFHDLLTNPEIEETSWKQKVKQFLYQISPHAGIVFLLDADPREIQMRKPEFAVEKITEVRRKYLEIVQKYDASIMMVDNTRPEDATVEDCLNILWRHFSKT